MRIHRTRQSVVNLVILFFVIYVKRYQKKLDFILFCLLFQEYNKRFKWLLFVDMIMTLLHDEFFIPFFSVIVMMMDSSFGGIIHRDR